MVETDSTAPAVRTAWEHARAACRVLALSAYGLLAAVGALLAPQPSLAIGVPLALLAAAVVAGLHRVPEIPRLPHPAVAGVRMACLPAAVAGGTAVGAPGSIAGALALIAVTAYTGYWATLPPAGVPGTSGTAAPGGGDERSLRELLRRLPTDVLLDEWRSTQTPTGPSTGRPADDALLRGLLIDELQRRDPAGTTRWLVDGFDQPPDGYLGDRAG